MLTFSTIKGANKETTPANSMEYYLRQTNAICLIALFFLTLSFSKTQP
jgi:hypothetical protein